MDDPQALERRLARLQAAMVPRAAGRASRREERRRQRKQSQSPVSLLVIAVAFIAASIATGKNAFMIPGVILAVIGAARLLGTALSSKRDATQPHIGLGVEIGAGAVVEPGAVIEMGAEVRENAVVRSGAVVRMGADIGANAVIESGAVIGWGCDIEAGAVVEAGAVIGAGATVRKGARVPAGMRIAPGATFVGGAPRVNVPSPSEPVAAPVKDERRTRIESSCARIEGELKQLPQTFREHLGATGETAVALRSTCLSLLDRERALRAEASDESLAFLDTERAELEKRIAAATDDAVKRSLSSAVAAIGDQKKQRLQLRTQADRLDAEVTRLQWTLDGMATQLLRLRSAGVDAGKPPSSEVMQSVQQLHEEIDAITEALEEVAKTDSPMLTPISDVSGEPSSSGPSGQRVR